MTQFKRLGLASTFLFATTFCGFLPSSTLAQKNVIVIVTDDAGYADFGFSQTISGGGFEDTNGNKVSLTPNLDALAARGVTMSRAYVAPNCQPTRTALVTGGYQQRVGAENVGNNHFRADQVFEGVPNDTATIWDRFKEQSYATGAVGKWHLGQIENSGGVFGNRPENQGIDQFYGMWHGDRQYTLRANINNQAQAVDALREVLVTTRDANGNATTFTDVVREGGGQTPGYKVGTAQQILYNGPVADPSHEANNYVTTLFGKYSADFISEHAGNSQPFMLYQSFTAPHKPWEATSPFYNDPVLTGTGAGQLGLTGAANEDRRRVASLMKTMDFEIGRTLDRLKDPNGDGDTSDSIEDDTLIVFVNDNGGVAPFGGAGTDNGIFANGKGSMRDGGIRVPMIIAGAGVDASVQGTTYDKAVHGIDVLPTVLNGVLTSGADKVDGINLLPFVNGQDNSNPHDVIVNKWRGTFALIDGDGQYKLINTVNYDSNSANPKNGYRLYDTATNVTESDSAGSGNLFNDAGQADRRARLLRELTRHEGFFDKGRYAILNRRVDDDLNGNQPGSNGINGNALLDEPRNIFDHFVVNPNGATSFNWGDTDRWVAKDGIDNIPNSDGSSPGKTMYTSDSFAGAILEFVATNNQSYTATNNLVRQTGQHFMLNKMLLSGDFTGNANQSATITGGNNNFVADAYKKLVFTNDLDGVAPEIAIDSLSDGANDFTFNINMDIVMFDHLSITGDGTSNAIINGVISEFYLPTDPNEAHFNDLDFGARNLTKTGASTATITGTNTYSGRTIVEGGTLALSGNGSIDNSSEIEVQAGATLDATGHNTGVLNLAEGQTLMGSGDVLGGVAAAANTVVAPGSSFGQLTVNGNMTLNATTDVEIEVGPGIAAGVDYDQLLVVGTLNLSGAELMVLADDPTLFDAGDEFQIFLANSIIGDFSNIILPQLQQGLTWDTSQIGNGGSGVLSISGSAIPEPSSVTLLAIFGLLGMSRRMNRR